MAPCCLYALPTTPSFLSCMRQVQHIATDGARKQFKYNYQVPVIHQKLCSIRIHVSLNASKASCIWQTEHIMTDAAHADDQIILGRVFTVWLCSNRSSHGSASTVHIPKFNKITKPYINIFHFI